MDGVAPIEQDDSEDIAAHIDAYGETLVTLPDEAWQTSVCRWQLSYWDVLIDLFTLEEGISDLVLFARVFQREDGYEFRINSVHVP